MPQMYSTYVGGGISFTSTTLHYVFKEFAFSFSEILTVGYLLTAYSVSNTLLGIEANTVNKMEKSVPLWRLYSGRGRGKYQDAHVDIQCPGQGFWSGAVQ